MNAEIKFGEMGGGGGVAEGLFESVAASTQHSFTTTNKAKAVWIIFIGTTGDCRVITNVNPTTGVINNNDIYYDRSVNGGTPIGWTQWTGLSFTITNNSVAPSSNLGGAASMQKILYTY